MTAPAASGALAQDDVRGGAGAGDMLGAFVAQGAKIDPLQEMLAAAEQDGSDGEVELVDETGLEKLPDRGDPATQPRSCGSTRTVTSSFPRSEPRATVRAPNETR